MVPNSEASIGCYQHLRALRSVAIAGDKFEPFPVYVLPGNTLSQLLEADLAEAGPSCRPAVASIGYRLTQQGWHLATRNWTTRRRRRV